MWKLKKIKGKTHTCRHNTPLPWQKKKKIKKIKSKIYDKEKDNDL